ncbi:enoyl-CoA hydratase-related protein [Aeromicrobium sp. UC242_57]|uniref:enoyl-CoA hydratase-related protein n=1 Tax=Aeromicrobium sp. UC242_57 TaxID=3374624 RepID=UPI00378CCC83
MPESTMELKTITFTVDRGVATLTLNRPERGNAWTGRMEAEYRHVLAEASESDRVGAIIVTGAGRQFCVGADARAVSGTSERGSYSSGLSAPLAEPGSPDHPAHMSRHGFLLSIPKPVIAAVNGAAAGIGFGLACFADVRFVAEDAKLTTSTSRLGLPPEFAVSWILPRLIGASRATHLLLGSPVMMGREAADVGWAHRAAPRGSVLDAASAYAHDLVRTASPGALAAAKQQMWLDLERSLAEADRDAQVRLEQMVGSEDFATGAAALKTGTRPDFSARYNPRNIDTAEGKLT